MIPVVWPKRRAGSSSSEGYRRSEYSSVSQPDSRTRGVTLLELMVVLVIIAVGCAIAVPALARWSATQRLSDSARVVDGALARARSEARRTGNVRLVFFGTDAQGNTLHDALGNAVPILVLDDGQPGTANQNCVIDAGETFETYTFAAPEVVYGVYAAGTKVPSDAGAGAMTSGASFVDDGGGNARWVMFRPDGMPLAFDSSCNLGAVGSGGGAVYLNNGNRDVAAVLTPLGATRVHAFNRASNAWTQ